MPPPRTTTRTRTAAVHNDPGTRLLIQVPGCVPAPQGSKKAVGTRTSKAGKLTPILVESCPRVEPWRKIVALFTRQAMARHRLVKFDGPLRIEIVFTMQPAGNVPPSEWATTYPDTQHYGDTDKLIRSTFDAVADGGAVVNDARFVDVRAVKVFPGHPGSLPKPGAIIRISYMPPLTKETQ